MLTVDSPRTIIYTEQSQCETLKHTYITTVAQLHKCLPNSLLMFKDISTDLGNVSCSGKAAPSQFWMSFYWCCASVPGGNSPDQPHRPCREWCNLSTALTTLMHLNINGTETQLYDGLLQHMQWTQWLPWHLHCLKISKTQENVFPQTIWTVNSWEPAYYLNSATACTAHLMYVFFLYSIYFNSFFCTLFETTCQHRTFKLTYI